jgi:hypothetical protein
LGAAALVVGAGNTTWLHRLQGALLLTLAIFSLHFTAMGAASIVRDPTIIVAGSAMPPGWVAVGVAMVGLAILTLTLVGVGLDRRDRRRTATFARDIAAARKAEEQQNLLIAELDHRVKNVLARVPRSRSARANAAARWISSSTSSMGVSSRWRMHMPC